MRRRKRAGLELVGEVGGVVAVGDRTDVVQVRVIGTITIEVGSSERLLTVKRSSASGVANGDAIAHDSLEFLW